MLYSFQSLAWLNFLSSACRVGLQLRQTKLGYSILQYYLTQKFTLGIKTQMTIFNWIHFFPWCSLMWDCLTFFSAIISLSYITHKQFNINLRPDLQCTRRPTWFWLLYMGTPLFEFAPWALWWICALYRFSFRRVSGATATKGGGGNKPEPPSCPNSCPNCAPIWNVDVMDGRGCPATIGIKG